MKKTLLFAITFCISFYTISSYVHAQTVSSFNKNLELGNSGIDVSNLQSFLISKKLNTKVTGYFGPLTKAALAQYQVSKSIKPSVGYFGPLTRAVVNADTVVQSSVLVATTTPPTSTPVTSGSEGTLDVRLAGSPANNANIQTSTDVAVYGLTLKASISNVTVDRLDFQVAVVNSGSTENPATLINTIKVWDGSTVLKSWSVTSADFTKDVNDSTVYYIRLSGLGYVVPVGTTKTLTVSFSTNSGIDTDRTVTIDGYQTNSLRAVSGNNITSYYSIDGAGFSRTHTFKKPGTSVLYLISDPDTFGYNNERINTTSGAQDVDVATFKLRSEVSDSIVTDIVFNVTSSDTLPSVVSLYDGDTKLDSRSVSSGLVTFNDVHISIAKDETKILGVKIDMQSNTPDGTYVSVGDATTTITYQKPNGTSAVLTSNALAVYPAYFYQAAPQFEFGSSTITSTYARQNGSTTSLTGVFHIKFTPIGGTMNKLNPSDITVDIGEDTDNLSTVSNIDLSVSPNQTLYADGATYDATVTATVYNSELSENGVYTMYITGVNWTMTAHTPVNQIYDFDGYAYKTDPIVFIK